MGIPANNCGQLFIELNDRYRARFGDIIPLMMIPESETIENLTALVNECFRQNKDLLPEYYGWRDDVYY